MKEDVTGTAAQQPAETDLQTLTTAGYLYLIMLGISADVLYFKFFGIDILKYSGITDVVLSPITTILKDVRTMVAFTLTGGLAFYFLRRQKVQAALKMGKDAPQMTGKGQAALLAALLAGMILGFRIGAAIKAKQRLDEGTLGYTTTLVMADNTTRRVAVIGQNSSYIFFCPEGEHSIVVMPISGNVKEIR